MMLHSMLHDVVETQIAIGEPVPTSKVMDRLLREGLDRHDAIHAISAVLVRFIYHLTRDGKPPAHAERATDPYYDELNRLTAAKWRSGKA